MSVTWPQLIEGIPSIALRDIDYMSATTTTTTTTTTETLIGENRFETWVEQVNLKAPATNTASTTNLTNRHDQGQQQREQQQKAHLQKLVLRTLPLNMNGFKHFIQLSQLYFAGIYIFRGNCIQTLPVDNLLAYVLVWST